MQSEHEKQYRKLSLAFMFMCTLSCKNIYSYKEINRAGTQSIISQRFPKRRNSKTLKD